LKTGDVFHFNVNTREGNKIPISGEVIEVTLNPLYENHFLAAEVYSAKLGDLGDLDGAVIVPAKREYSLYPVVHSGNWLCVHYHGEGSGSGSAPAFRNPERCAAPLLERFALKNLVATDEWGGDEGGLRIMKNCIGAGMVAIAHAGYVNPVGRANEEKGLTYQEKAEMIRRIGMDILRELGYRSKVDNADS
jgi:hypothetical protein